MDHDLAPDNDLVEWEAAQYVRTRGRRALAYLDEQAEIAEQRGDAESAQTWRELAAAAGRILSGH
jgi:hypothetical protein